MDTNEFLTEIARFAIEYDKYKGSYPENELEGKAFAEFVYESFGQYYDVDEHDKAIGYGEF